ncbi:MAG: DUF4349 domain-containing protein, partial [Actinomycetes bacterium]
MREGRAAARRRRRWPTVAAAVGAMMTLALAGCSADHGGDSGTTAADQVGNKAGAPAAEGPGGGDDAGGGVSAGSEPGNGGTGDSTSARVLPTDRDIVYRGRITIRVRDVGRAAGRAEDLALQADGVVFSQETSVDPDRAGGGEAQLTLRVPPSQFAGTLDALGALGKELSRARSAQDVTTELADTGSRVRSQERSVERVRTLLGEADTIGEVVQVEAELARREADLESLQAQLARLKDVTDLATIEVTFFARGEAVEPEPAEDELGFLSGLRGGWAALGEVALVVLT